MKMTLYQLDLPLAHEFTIARESISVQRSLIVELEHEGISGFGEVTENRFYGHTLGSISASLEKTQHLLGKCLERSPEDLWNVLKVAVGFDRFALSAIDIALHDLRGKRLGVPTWKDWGFRWKDTVQSSYTIGIDAIDKMIAKLAEQSGWSIYKIKLGTDNDVQIVRQLRKHTDAVFRVDANCGWTAQETIDNSKVLADLGVEFIEQPLPIGACRDDKLRVFNESALPIVADEDCQVSEDVVRCVGLFHGINVKVCKCGGLTPALAMLRQARRLGMKTMVGCMVESSVGISAAAQLLPLLDYADFDGALLLRDDPATGVVVDKGLVRLSSYPGCGAVLDRIRAASFCIAEADTTTTNIVDRNNLRDGGRS
ncbi:L-Ala-D/L-Glu epimerase [Planctomycetes bacterium CA13]|uniref:Dipeptide epimerase n=1 Tax=Novipirellula herctigrandis TaxID=2527986 RepID=A0A5C5YYS0_9BACT|nr:L-Ala-D/L-Glu epimerase [Planctomycetes bacterium CA13]